MRICCFPVIIINWKPQGYWLLCMKVWRYEGICTEAKEHVLILFPFPDSLMMNPNNTWETGLETWCLVCNFPVYFSDTSITLESRYGPDMSGWCRYGIWPGLASHALGVCTHCLVLMCVFVSWSVFAHLNTSPSSHLSNQVLSVQWLRGRHKASSCRCVPPI